MEVYSENGDLFSVSLEEVSQMSKRSIPKWIEKWTEYTVLSGCGLIFADDPKNSLELNQLTRL